MEDLSYGAIVTVALGSSVVGSMITQLFIWLRELKVHRRDEKDAQRERAYLALRLATIFECYAKDAVAIISEVSIDEVTFGQSSTFTSCLPTLGELPSATERWRELPVNLTSRVLGFEQYVQSLQIGINDYISVAGITDIFDEMRVQCRRVGCRALDIAAALRREYDLPPLEAAYDWEGRLRKSHAD